MTNPDPYRVVDIDELYPLAWGTDPCTRCGAETTTTDAWGDRDLIVALLGARIACWRFQINAIRRQLRRQANAR